MRDCAIEPPMCTSDAEARFVTGDPTMVGDCGNTIVAYLMFDVFYMVGANILLNLFVAVLLESFFNYQEQNHFIITERHLESFQSVWHTLDPSGSGKIHRSKLRLLLEQLHACDNPLGSVVLASEFKFRSVRVELLQSKAQNEALEHQEVLHVLGLHVVGSEGLPFSEMLVRQEKMGYYAQLAAVSKSLSLFRSLCEHYHGGKGGEESAASARRRASHRRYLIGDLTPPGQRADQGEDEGSDTEQTLACGRMARDSALMELRMLMKTYCEGVKKRMAERARIEELAGRDVRDLSEQDVAALGHADTNHDGVMTQNELLASLPLVLTVAACLCIWFSRVLTLIHAYRCTANFLEARRCRHWIRNSGGGLTKDIA